MALRTRGSVDCGGSLGDETIEKYVLEWYNP